MSLHLVVSRPRLGDVGLTWTALYLRDPARVTAAVDALPEHETTVFAWCCGCDWPRPHLRVLDGGSEG